MPPDQFWTRPAYGYGSGPIARAGTTGSSPSADPAWAQKACTNLIDSTDLPGTTWTVDLPGDGSNTDPPGGGNDPFGSWPAALIEAADAFPGSIFVGHSTGGMHLLSVEDLETRLAGLVLTSSAPDSSWRAAFNAMAERNPLPGLTSAIARFESDPTNETLREITVQAAPWNFTPDGLVQGTDLLCRLPINKAAVDWSSENFDDTYHHSWWPAELPTLIISGSADRVVAQDVWDREDFNGDNVVRRTIDGGGHFPWIERPAAVRDAFADLVACWADGPAAATSMPAQGF
jgi:pimeloyl-ACP methyl ester carboxylesterase